MASTTAKAVEQIKGNVASVLPSDLALFDSGTGLLVRVCAAPMRTHDMSQAERMHGEMQPGDVVLADRGFCSYAHLALLFQAGIHGVFRIHQTTIVSFHKGRVHVGIGLKHPQRKSPKGLPRSRSGKWLAKVDQIVERFKPTRRPDWITEEAYAALTKSPFVRELPGFDEKILKTEDAST